MGVSTNDVVVCTKCTDDNLSGLRDSLYAKGYHAYCWTCEAPTYTQYVSMEELEKETK